MSILKTKLLLNGTSCISSAPSTVSEKVYFYSRQTPPVWVTYHFPKLRISLFALWQLRVRFVSVEAEENIMVIQKMTIKRQIPDFIYYGKTILPNHWNYCWKKLQLHSNDVAPKMQWNWSVRSFQALTMYHTFHSFRGK